ncbi:biopolymer transporter ExbD [Pseudothauera rhizosphaerae]|uniref:Biopolymer transporter ExbD n=1 Tax=Pseudothauera rhizosphaerae TaxID=2565932 RepID=A0A4S4ALK8_9RHOO|nr:biopolymer transporter ExbD [Pseudothauera rhizosphaerae]THF60322.1 biopolymer transporter ExbD [Pseudothauera rhizosphaerae]
MDDKGFESLNMIPFIDIMLVLLTIVLTTSSFIATGRIAVNLPEASRQQAELQESWVIEIDAQGQLFRDGEALSLEGLEGRVAGLEKDTAFLLRADKALALQRFIDVVDLLKQKGFARIAVETVAAG